MKTRPEWKPCTPLQPEVIRKSSIPSPSMSPMVTASKPKASPGVLPVKVFIKWPSRPEYNDARPAPSAAPLYCQAPTIRSAWPSPSTSPATEGLVPKPSPAVSPVRVRSLFPSRPECTYTRPVEGPFALLFQSEA